MNNFLTNFFYRLAYIDQKNNLFLVKELVLSKHFYTVSFQICFGIV